jgi:hypothetical protein
VKPASDARARTSKRRARSSCGLDVLDKGTPVASLIGMPAKRLLFRRNSLREVPDLAGTARITLGPRIEPVAPLSCGRGV